MRFELDTFREGVAVETDARTEPSRKTLREATDLLIHNALLVNDLPELVRLSAETMADVATILVRYARDPQVPDFVEASRALLVEARDVMDRGLMLRSFELVDCGAVMLEIVVRGICAALSVPYDKVMLEMKRARDAGENPEIRRILTDAGLLKAEAIVESEGGELG